LTYWDVRQLVDPGLLVKVDHLVEAGEEGRLPKIAALRKFSLNNNNDY